jgi:flagellar motor switch protein FliG
MNVATGEEKAALLLTSLPAEIAETLLGKLGPDRRARVRAQMARLQDEPEASTLLGSVLTEFNEVVRGTQARSFSVVSAAGESPRSAAEPPKTDPRVEDSTLAGAPLEALGQMNIDLLAEAVKGEHPRTIMLLLNHFDANRGGELLKRLTPEERKQVSAQLSRPVSPNATLLQRIAEAVVTKARKLGNAATPVDPEARFRKIADMLRFLDKADRKEMLASLEEQDPDTAAKVKDQLYQFEDLLLIEARSMQKLLTEIDLKSLALALKNASEAIREKVLGNLSKRARESLTEEMEFLGSVPAAQVQQAQKVVVDVIQRLDQAGELVMTQ